MKKRAECPVSVIVPCFNSLKTIERAILSILNQSILALEIIIVDDCSNDNAQTHNKLVELQNHYHSIIDIVLIFLDKNSGPGCARNKGWEKAKGEYIAFLDADDSWHYQKLEVQYQFMSSNPCVALSGHAFKEIQVTPLSDINYFSDSLTFAHITEKKLLMSNCFSTPSVMLRGDLKQRFPTDKKYAEDYHLWLDICFSGGKCYRLNRPLVYLYKDSYGYSGLSSALWKMELGELDAYSSLFRAGRLHFLCFCVCIVWSSLKFLKRLINIKIKKLFKLTSNRNLDGTY